MAEIASAIPATNRAWKVWPWRRPRSTIRMNATPAMPAMTMVSRSSCFCRGVLSASVLLRRSAMWPISVSIPVVVTIISPRPRVTEVFMKAMQRRSPRPTSGLAMASVSFSVGVLSPVRAASSISRVAATNRRPSAGTRLPASIRTTSPGTSVSASTSMACPSRRTRATFLSICCREDRLASALASPRSPSTALRTVRPTSTRVVPSCPVKTRLMAAAASRMSCMKSWYWRRKACSPDSFAFAASWLGPCCCRRCAASAALSPRAGSTPRRWATASGVRLYQAGSCPAGAAGAGDAVDAVVVISHQPLSGRFRGSVGLGDVPEGVQRRDVVPRRLALGQLHRLPRHLLVGDQAQQVGDAVQARPALVVGVHHPPGALRGVRGREHGVPGPREIVPAAVRLQVHRAELPDLARVVDALLEPLGLVGHAHLQPVLDQDDPRVDDRPLHRRDDAQEGLHLRRGGEGHHPLHPGAVVPATVEEHDLPPGRQVGQVALGVHLGPLPLGRRRQGYVAEDARAGALGQSLDYPALAGGVPPLEQHADLGPLGPDPLLQPHQLRL